MQVRNEWRAWRRQKFLHCAQIALLVLGCSGLGFCAFVYFQAAVFQKYEQWRLEKTLVSNSEPKDAFHEAAERPAVRSVVNGDVLGRVEIPRIGLSVVLVEGIRKRNLRIAVGHIPGTARPNEIGNLGIAGHRDTFFRDLGRIRADDVVIVRTSAGSSAYSVESIRVVEPSNTDVLDASTQPVLTLVTCYPFHYIGPAPERFIVRARLAGRSEGQRGN
jgi:sortase A